MAKSLRTATKKAIHQSKVQSLDNLGTDFNQVIQQDGMSVIEQHVGNFIERVHENINREKNMVTTGAINNIEIKVEGSVVNVYANPHLIYQDRGVNGRKVKRYDTPHSYADKRPSVDVFRKWVKSKKLFLTDKNDYRRQYDDRLSPTEQIEDRSFKELTDDEKIDKAAWAMSTKVWNEGFKPRPIYSKEIPQLVTDIQQNYGDFVLQQIAKQININPRAGGGKRIVIKP